MNLKPLLIAISTLTIPLAGIVSAQPSFIPQPESVKLSTSYTKVSLNIQTELKFVAGYLKKELTKLGVEGKGSAIIKLSVSNSLTSDYRIIVDPRSILIQGKDEASVFYGIQTFLQMFEVSEGKISQSVPQGVISDSAMYDWRGFMLDSSRHFQTVEEIKNYLDMMAHYKLNVFHWHLTDDQGWRIEIKSHPKLTSIGAWRVPREGIWWHRPGPKKGEKATYGGFYTQEQIKDVVQYAKDRHIEVIPEIDVPGHGLSILAGYPELSTTGGPFQVNPGSPFYNKIENTLDPSNPASYKLLEDIFAEVVTLFPSKYVHIGGDEATKKFWDADPDCQKFMKDNKLKNSHELQSYFIKRCEKMLAKHNKQIIGWDEILDGGLADTATVMSWRGVAGGDKAAKMGRPVIMASNSAYYFDLYQGHPEYEPATYAKCRLKQSYMFDYKLPEGVDPKLLLGMHGCLWTEEVPNIRHGQYMTWPRCFALSESAWRRDRTKDWKGFVSRVERHFERFDLMDVNYATSMYDPMLKLIKKEKRAYIELATEIDGLAIHYTFDEGEVDHHYPVYKKPLLVPYGATTIRVRTYRNGKPVGKLRTIIIGNINKPKKSLFPTAISN